MSNPTVKDLMIPVADYACVSHDASLYEAIEALDAAQRKVPAQRHFHRALLVKDADGKVVGKLSMLDVLAGLEPKYSKILEKQNLSRFGVSPELMKDVFQQHSLWDDPLFQLCAKGANLKVSNIMYAPGEGEYVPAEADLVEAIHQLVMGCHQSLLAMDGKEIVGILRLSDVFREVGRQIKSCKM